jgi:hypothetical protein
MAEITGVEKEKSVHYQLRARLALLYVMAEPKLEQAELGFSAPLTPPI